tara:strand:+ start:986 stop:1621 length:636 start_codon:yes stop_codon:yes gene_type:complete
MGTINKFYNLNNHAFDSMNKAATNDIEAELKNVLTFSKFGPKSSRFLRDWGMKHLNIPAEEIGEWMGKWHNYAMKVREVESLNRKGAEATGSSAKGVYQFLSKKLSKNNAVQTARQRAYNLDGIANDESRYGIGWDFIKGISDDPSEWTNDQADLMFLVNLAAQEGSDEYFKNVGYGSNGKELYYQFHHTDPSAINDEGKVRIDNILGKEK